MGKPEIILRTHNTNMRQYFLTKGELSKMGQELFSNGTGRNN
jgi:hypothetical protein